VVKGMGGRSIASVAQPHPQPVMLPHSLVLYIVSQPTQAIVSFDGISLLQTN